MLENDLNLNKENIIQSQEQNMVGSANKMEVGDIYVSQINRYSSGT